MGEVSSVKNLFWTSHKLEKARTILKRKIFSWNDVAENMKWIFSFILEN